MRICLVITGSIAAYKSAVLARELMRLGHVVQVVMSKGGQQFITPLTLQTLTGRPVATDLWSLQEESSVGHIKIADEADLVLVAPASANFIAAIAGGFATGVAEAVVLATRAPVLVSPAMNVNMYENIATQENLARIVQRGIRVLNPVSGMLACGWTGMGRFPEVEDIISEIDKVFPQPLKGRSLIITAGPTRERIDPMRVITNLSSGKMGCSIASEAKKLGGNVVLLAGPGVDVPNGITTKRFQSTGDLHLLLENSIKELQHESDLSVIMAAAPADYRPKEYSNRKLPKEEELSLRLTSNPDIIKDISLKRDQFPNLKRIVAFAADDSENLIERASKKLSEKRVDFIVANDILGSVNQDTTELFLLDKIGVRGSSKRVTKKAAASWLIEELFLI